MKKLHLLLLVAFTGITAFAQKTIQSTLKDITTGEPVEMATITADGTTISTISNAEGVFRLSLPANAATLTVSHLNYKPYTVSVANAGDEIHLEPSIITLEEVVVSSIPVEDLLKSAVKTSKKRLEKSLLLNTYYREFIKINGRDVRFADGLVDFYVKRKSGAADVYVQQSRAKKMISKGEKSLFKYGGDSITAKDEKDLENVSVYRVDEAISDGYNFKMTEKILSYSKDYDYTLKTRQDKNGRNLQIVTIKPKTGTKAGIYSGTVTYDTQTMLILETNIGYDPAYIQNAIHAKFLGFDLLIFASEKRTVFTLDKDKYIVTYNKSRIGLHIKYKDKFDDSMECVSDVVVNNFKETEEGPDRDTRFKGKALYAAGTHYTTEFWKNSNALVLTAAEEKLLQSME
jgi:CarboxypepD_reg-like domain